MTRMYAQCVQTIAVKIVAKIPVTRPEKLNKIFKIIKFPLKINHLNYLNAIGMARIPQKISLKIAAVFYKKNSIT